MKTIKYLSIFLTILFSQHIYGASSSNAKGSMSANAVYNWSTKKPNIRVSWNLKNEKYIWVVNKDGYKYRVCWEKKKEGGTLCNNNESLLEDFVTGVNLTNTNFNTEYKVRVEAFGQHRFWGVLSTWQTIGKVDVKTMKYMSCDGPFQWWDNSVDPSYDGANCFVAKVPSGFKPFIWNNKYYVEDKTPGSCPVGSWDGANCWLGNAPPGTKAFIWNNKYYYSE